MPDRTVTTNPVLTNNDLLHALQRTKMEGCPLRIFDTSTRRSLHVERVDITCHGSESEQVCILVGFREPLTQERAAQAMDAVLIRMRTRGLHQLAGYLEECDAACLIGKGTLRVVLDPPSDEAWMRASSDAARNSLQLVLAEVLHTELPIEILRIAR